MPKQKRDNSYYLDRLKRERPDIHADLQAGKFRNASEAFVLAGLRKPRTPLDQLISAWAKAGPAERDAFLRRLTAMPVSPHGPHPAPGAPPATLTARNAPQPPLSLAEIADIRAIMDRRKIKNGDIMREIGLDPLDASLGVALSRGTRLRDDLLVRLRPWIAANRSPGT